MKYKYLVQLNYICGTIPTNPTPMTPYENSSTVFFHNVHDKMPKYYEILSMVFLTISNCKSQIFEIVCIISCESPEQKGDVTPSKVHK